MRVRRYVSLGLFAVAAACGSQVDTPTAPPSLRLTSADFDGDPPPPPVDTQFVASLDGEQGSVGGTYFTNNPERVYWFSLQTLETSDPTIIASPNARLMYNAGTGKTIGVGTLVFPSGRVLDLSTVTLSVVRGYPIGTCGGGEIVVDAVARTCGIFVKPAPQR